ncbi:MAG: hypothetical protein KKD44_15630 [Proteobacteria bacterium]|nr:hypothetical protein [Pseudomonadota bacterium]
MNIYLCIDDTDEKDGPGTGHLLQALCENIQTKNWGTCSAISRHQLFVDDAIPYTSHNSSLCCEVELEKTIVGEVIEFCSRFLEEKSAPGSDPGLCVTLIDESFDREKLIQFGHMAKQTVLTKAAAYELARELTIHLSEHGGTGQGVIGALAGTGLRLSGNDGRFRGWYHLGREGATIGVKDLTSHGFIQGVQSETGEILSNDASVLLGGDELKTVLQGGRQIVLVTQMEKDTEGKRVWRTLTKKEVKRY